jgi:hypothetical protein
VEGRDQVGRKRPRRKRTRVSGPPVATPDPLSEDEREARSLSPVENADLCAGCVQCCTYITIEIDAPRSAWEYDQWIWALHHSGIEIYVERPEAWYLLVHTRCRRLNDHGRCSIYGRHPVLCREYDPRSCERRLPLADVRAWFHDAPELEAWLKEERPAHWRRLMEHRKDFVPEAPAAPAAAGWIPIADLIGAGGGGRDR